ncbi:MAG: DUF2147 domain-containing protein [Opitutales bacterium]|nr:DUF2147 domain-containing protein [Opitutales bacterium]
MKTLITALLFALSATFAFAADGVVGFWTTIDDETKEAKSVVQIYEYNGKIYGRVVDVLKNKDATAKLPGAPKIIGLDIIWNLKKDGDEYSGGKILDPQKGKVYGCAIWRDGENLIVRGKIAFFGRNQTWLPNKTFKGDGTPLTPEIPVEN